MKHTYFQNQIPGKIKAILSRFFICQKITLNFLAIKKTLSANNASFYISLHLNTIYKSSFFLFLLNSPIFSILHKR